jgi:hypothetical protein
MVLVAAYLCDVVGIRERGKNRGFWVERILQSIGLGPGYAWCAAFVSYCADLAEFSTGPKRGRAAVRSWAEWAKEENRLGFSPQRGDLVYKLNANGTGHIGVIIGAVNGRARTIEGNTDGGGSREGDGAYRRERMIGGTWKVIRT